MHLKPVSLFSQKKSYSGYNLSQGNFIHISDKKYVVKLAETPVEIDEALRLRFNVFNLELHEGLDSSYQTLRDEDDFDKQCHHLLVIEKSTHKIIGTYRLQTFESARKGIGFYSANEFMLHQLGNKVLKKSIELGRACIDKNNRNGRVLFLLWKGIAQYVQHTHKRYLFGCCSLTSQDPVEGRTYMDYLERHGHVHSKFLVMPAPDYECYNGPVTFTPRDDLILPPLMDMYIRYGGKICGPPAIDRDFKTIDYLVLLDVHELNEETRKVFF
jgi:putative hemolysin